MTDLNDGEDTGSHSVGEQPEDRGSRTRRAARVHKTPLWLRVTLGSVLVVLIGVLAWGGWQLWQLGSDLLGLRDTAAQAQRHVQARDFAAFVGDVTRARELAARADVVADAPAVVFAAGLPWVGDDVTVARELAGVASDLATASTRLDPLLGRLAGGASPDLSMAGDALGAIGPIRTAAETAAAQLDRLDLTGLILPVGDDIARLRDALGNVGPAVDSLSPYLNAVAILTTPNTSHTWFVVLQNLGEARPSGGFLGGWLLVRTSGGELKVLDQGANDELLSHKFDYTGYLPAGYEQVWGDSMKYWQSLNMSANFPDNARLFAHAWNSHAKVKADGVLALGQGSVSLLAGAAGPVEVNGRTVAPADLSDYLKLGIYQEFSDPNAKDAALAHIVAQILDKITDAQFNVAGLFSAALDNSGADYLQLWSSDPAMQKQVRAAGLSGELTAQPGPVASVRLADAAANKLDSFMYLGAEYRLGACTVDDGGIATRSSTFTVTLRNGVPPGLPDYMTGKGDLLDGREHPIGSTRDFVVVYPPVQATVTSALVDGKPALVQTAWVAGRQMLVIDVALAPGASATIETAWEESPTDDEDRPFSLTPTIVLPPLANAAETRVVDGAACR